MTHAKFEVIADLIWCTRVYVQFIIIISEDQALFYTPGGDFGSRPGGGLHAANRGFGFVSLI